MSRGMRGIPIYPQMPDVEVEEKRPDERIHVLLEDIKERFDKESRHHKRLETAIWRKESPGYLTIPIVASAGALQGDMSMRPEKGCTLSVRNISVGGYSAGTVTVSRVNGVLLATFGANGGSVFYGKRQIWLEQNDQLVVTATGITGAPQIYLDSDEMESWYARIYIG